MKHNIEYIEGVSDGIDFDSTYSVKGHEGIAWVLLGWEPTWEPFMALMEDEDGNEYEEDTGEGEWVPEIGGRIACRMVGDDQIFYFDKEDITILEEDEFCHECGQVGCKAYS